MVPGAAWSWAYAGVAIVERMAAIRSGNRAAGLVIVIPQNFLRFRSKTLHAPPLFARYDTIALQLEVNIVAFNGFGRFWRGKSEGRFLRALGSTTEMPQISTMASSLLSRIGASGNWGVRFVPVQDPYWDGLPVTFAGLPVAPE